MLQHTQPDTYGYQEAHALYKQIRQQLQEIAHQSGDSAQVVMVKASMVLLKDGQRKHKTVGDIAESIPDVLVHIGAEPLKWTVFNILHHRFKKYTNQRMSLELDSCRIRNKQWVDIIPLRSPDRDAISAHFFTEMPVKGKSRSSGHFKPLKVFNDKIAKQGIEILLEIPYSDYERALRYWDGQVDEDEIEEQQKQHRASAAGSSKVTTGTGTRHSVVNLDNTPTRDLELSRKGKSSIHTGLDSVPPATITCDDIEQALRRQQPPSKPAVVAFLNSVDIDMLITTCPKLPFATLVHNANNGLLWTSGVPRKRYTLTYTPSTKPMQGACKIAFFAVSQPGLEGFGSGGLVIKQAFRHESDSATNQEPNDKSEPSEVDEIEEGQCSTQASPEFSLLESGQQVQSLSQEIVCIQWASALMALVYKFIDKAGRPPFPVPELRFVRSALALEADVTGPFRRVFMVEERIDTRMEGEWCKYINNNSAIPLPCATTSKERQQVADFLTFCQHVQYMRTKKCVYVSDFQGSLFTLTDPQIITSPELGNNLFASGNISHAFERFPKQHVYSKFCNYYHLRFD
ncbi:hypothetical protein C8Q80DRAFT_1274231 [Daedaleopsis nitida]|nr:hypothetical protein C8Q80DRAFT_1274231 [Daedaleopsis nitida]